MTNCCETILWRFHRSDEVLGTLFSDGLEEGRCWCQVSYVTWVWRLFWYEEWVANECEMNTGLMIMCWSKLSCKLMINNMFTPGTIRYFCLKPQIKLLEMFLFKYFYLQCSMFYKIHMRMFCSMTVMVCNFSYRLFKWYICILLMIFVNVFYLFFLWG